MTALVTAEGSLAIPPELRERLGLTPGQTMEVQTEGRLLVAWKASEDDQFEKWRGRGRLPAAQSTAEYLHLIRDGNGR
ncbi:MAG TPA: AbrB/MazE/SpoVT family DNA-binding domain-containing protein [Verrucomicrobiota bacterium]|nr:hypothetical protein [Verrucomicrobiales bacterium]HRI14508.1 AbrB/MazE/SpoVT family DNA-binding domain-containing protein [Verrucomicrobiota bacterium]